MRRGYGMGENGSQSAQCTAKAATRTIASIIHATPIRRDQEGRYCLNDLHRAAGGEDRHAPWRFIRLETTSALADAISKTPDVVIKPIDLSRGRYGGTYVHEDLAIDYAAWISPAFKLEVYRAFKESRKDHATTLGGFTVSAGGRAGAGAALCARESFHGQCGARRYNHERRRKEPARVSLIHSETE
jgi:hypothetical protein